MCIYIYVIYNIYVYILYIHPVISNATLLVDLSYGFSFKVLTIFSASNYYEIGSNKGAYIKLMPDLKPRIIQYSSHNNPTRKLTIKQRSVVKWWSKIPKMGGVWWGE